MAPMHHYSRSIWSANSSGAVNQGSGGFAIIEPKQGAIKSVGHSHIECGGKRRATPLWIVFVPYPSQDEPLKPKRRRASLAAALHMAVAATFNRTRPKHAALHPPAHRLVCDHV